MMTALRTAQLEKAHFSSVFCSRIGTQLTSKCPFPSGKETIQNYSAHYSLKTFKQKTLVSKERLYVYAVLIYQHYKCTEIIREKLAILRPVTPGMTPWHRAQLVQGGYRSLCEKQDIDYSPCLLMTSSIHPVYPVSIWCAITDMLRVLRYL